MSTHVREITTDEGWDEAVPVIRQLWCHESEAFVRSWRDEDDYRLFGVYETEADVASDPGVAVDDPPERGTLLAVAGVSVQRVLHHERHLWIHDFVVDEPRRGEGVGEDLLDWLDAWARRRDCENLALACWGENDEGRSFYESQGLDVWGQVVEREL